jgi:hypothetical protein
MLRSRVHALLAGAILLGAVALSSPVSVQASPPCPGGIEVKGPGPVRYCADGVITSICIKAGEGVWNAKEDGTYGCYDVKGIGTDCVVVSGGGTSSSCKTLSHVRFYVDKK